MAVIILGVVSVVALALIIWKPKQVILSVIAFALLGTVATCTLIVVSGAGGS